MMTILGDCNWLLNLVATSQTDPAAGAAQPGLGNCLDPSNLPSLLPIVAMIAIFYFLIIRPQQKQQKELRKMRDALKKDDRVITSGGMHGVVASVKGEIVSVRIADGVKVDIDRSAISSIERGQEGDS
jgi:preprotein translocase subunit YajC